MPSRKYSFNPHQYECKISYYSFGIGIRNAGTVIGKPTVLVGPTEATFNKFPTKFDAINTLGFCQIIRRQQHEPHPSGSRANRIETNHSRDRHNWR